MEQLEANLILHTQEVRGSSPCAPTIPTFLNQRFEILGPFHFRVLNQKTYQNRIKTPAVLICRIKTLSSLRSRCD
jgi:hypothetical protein